MDKVIELMDAACDKTTTPAYYNDYWTITQAELERFYELARADLEAENAKLCQNLSAMVKDAEHVKETMLREVGLGMVNEVTLSAARAAMGETKC